MTRITRLSLVSALVTACANPVGIGADPEVVCADLETHLTSCGFGVDLDACLAEPERAEDLLDLSCPEVEDALGSADSEFARLFDSQPIRVCADAAGRSILEIVDGFPNTHSDRQRVLYVTRYFINSGNSTGYRGSVDDFSRRWGNILGSPVSVPSGAQELATLLGDSGTRSARDMNSLEPGDLLLHYQVNPANNDRNVWEALGTFISQLASGEWVDLLRSVLGNQDVRVQAHLYGFLGLKENSPRTQLGIDEGIFLGPFGYSSDLSRVSLLPGAGWATLQDHTGATFIDDHEHFRTNHEIYIRIPGCR